MSATTHDVPAGASARPRVPDAALPWLGVLGALATVEFVVRVGLISSDYFPPVTVTAGALFDLLGESAYWSADPAHARGVRDRARDRDRDRGAGRPGAGLQRGPLLRGAAGGRVPAPGAVRRADPAGDPDLRHRAAEQGLPGRVRGHVAAVDPDDLRRPRPRSAAARDGALVPGPADGPDPARDPDGRRALHRHGPADRVGDGADPRDHRRVDHRLRRPGAGDQHRSPGRRRRPDVRPDRHHRPARVGAELALRRR